jgi:subtilisin family serine protease
MRLTSIRLSITLVAVSTGLLFASVLHNASADGGRTAMIASQRLAQRRAWTANPNLILLKREPIDTAARPDLDVADEDARSSLQSLTREDHEVAARIVHFEGPIEKVWVESLKTTGVQIIGYLSNNAYIVLGSARQLGRIANLHSSLEKSGRPIRWIGRFLPLQKIDPAFSEEMLGDAAGGSATVEIELADTAQAAAAVDYINSVAIVQVPTQRRFQRFLVVSATLPVARLLSIAAFQTVLYVGPTSSRRPLDERSAQIAAGGLNADQSQPVGAGYASWLAATGLDSPNDFLIDFTDTGLDRGLTSDAGVHPDFRDAEGHSRVAYSFNYTADTEPGDRMGHGTIVASVACGRGIDTLVDADGYLYGLGVCPNAGLGASRIFDSRGLLAQNLSFTAVASAAYEAGARISNNSWGNSSNRYDSVAQEYDGLVRDARPEQPGNQEMAFVFSAGNAGFGGHISSPGTAKNLITVAASENYRPEGLQICGTMVIGPAEANNAMDILDLSSSGPTEDGRAKPDIAAPGSHIYGAASQAQGFVGAGVCFGQGLYRPPNQRFYTWSSGTSLATPHVTGAAALIRKYLTSNNTLGPAQPPSPAMTKACLVNAATYMTGVNAADNLPGVRQGWGLLDIGRALDDEKRLYVDQSVVFTESGQTFATVGALYDRSRPLRITLAWTDAPAMLFGPALVNDLDLELRIGDTVYVGNSFEGGTTVPGGTPDRLNNIESIVLPPELIPEGPSGNLTITVRAANVVRDGIPGNGVDPDQDFALVISNITEPVTPPPSDPVISSATYEKKTLTITGTGFTAAALVEINGILVSKQMLFDQATNSLSVRAKRKKLKLSIGADNGIVVIEEGRRSAPFILHL